MTPLPRLRKRFLAGVLSLSLFSLVIPLSTSAADPAEPVGRGASSPSWYSSSWKYRQKITVNHELVGGSVDGFPMLVKLSGKVFDKAQSDGDDILFTAADGTTKLLHEIESMQGEVVAWVQMPHLSEKEDTVLYVYYGNPNAENQQQGTSVWKNGYVGVWHMNDSPTESQQDVTENNRDGTPRNFDSIDARETGRIGRAVEFDGNNDHITAGASLSGAAEFSVSLWVYQHSTGGSIYGKWVGSNTAYNTGFYFGRDVTPARIQFYVNEDFLQGPNNEFPFDEWVHAVAVFKSGKGKEIWVNGKLAASEGQTAEVRSHTGIEIGLDAVHGLSLGAHAKMDEIRVANVARSGAWIKTEYNNQSGRETFLTIAEPETQSASSTTADNASTTASSTSSPLTLSSPLLKAINALFSTAYTRIPTFSEWQYWATRVLAGDKATLPELLGAMQWQQLFGPAEEPDGRGASSSTGEVAGATTSGSTIEIRNGTTRQGLAGRTMQRLTDAGYAVTTVGNAQDYHREQSKVYVLKHDAYDRAAELAATLNIPVGLDLPAGDREATADILVVLGSDFSE